MFFTDDPITRKKVRMDLAGKTFGRFTVVEYSHTNKHGKSMWKCKCECGNERIVSGSHLTSRHSLSCGCLKKEITGERVRKHGMRSTRLYGVWLNIKNRCNNPKDDNYQYYGARGITICNEWSSDFTAFYDWAMANGYDENAKKGDCTIDRIDVNGNYEPSNCRWVGMKAQRANQRRVV